MPMRTLVSYLQLFRSQTAPATILLILVPFMEGGYNIVPVFILSLFGLLAHFMSFGENSLHDYIAGYDRLDPHKKHHPLCNGEISVHDAILVIHWSLPLLIVFAIVITLWLSPNPLLAIISLSLWYAFGSSYNLGLDKESVLAFLPISLSFTFMGGWAWALSHSNFNHLGYLFLTYAFFAILFQISVEGSIKEMEVKERSNILIKMGAKMDGLKFVPGRSRIYAWVVKGINVLFGFLLLLQNYSQVKTVAYVFFVSMIVFYLHQLTRTRIYIRDKELLKMSLMEIATIFLVVPLMLEPIIALILMIIGVAYFFLINLWIWKKPFPHV